MSTLLKGGRVSEELGTKLGSIGASPQMHFIIGRIIGENWVENYRAPLGAGFSISSDGFVTCEGIFIGGADDFERNIKGYVALAELTPEETAEFQNCLAATVSDWRKLGPNGGTAFEIEL